MYYCVHYLSQYCMAWQNKGCPARAPGLPGPARYEYCVPGTLPGYRPGAGPGRRAGLAEAEADDGDDSMQQKPFQYFTVLYTCRYSNFIDVKL
jgi:hypothetical protein